MGRKGGWREKGIEGVMDEGGREGETEGERRWREGVG